MSVLRFETSGVAAVTRRQHISAAAWDETAGGGWLPGCWHFRDWLT